MPCISGGPTPTLNDLKNAKSKIKRLNSYICALSNWIQDQGPSDFNGVISEIEIESKALGLSQHIKEHYIEDRKRIEAILSGLSDHELSMMKKILKDKLWKTN